MASTEEEDDDDYLNMVFEDPTSKGKETSLQRTARLKREAAERARIPSKAEREVQQRQAREKALATEIDASNKGAQMMAKMGFRGGALGKTEGARTRPIELQMKDDRGGIGMDSQKKRKLHEAVAEVDDGEKRRKMDPSEFRERNMLEQAERRAEGQMWGAMKVLEGFESEEQTDARSKARLRDVNILYRPLLKQRLQSQHEAWLRRELQNSLSTRPDAEDDEHGSDKDYDKRITELDDEDPELEEFDALNFSERRDRVVKELRSKHYYCFWCKYQYDDSSLDGCPGVTEDEHG